MHFEYYNYIYNYRHMPTVLFGAIYSVTTIAIKYTLL